MEPMSSARQTQDQPPGPLPAVAGDYFEQAFRLSHTALVVIEAQSWLILEANAAAARMLGRADVQGLIGSAFFDFVPSPEARAAHLKTIRARQAGAAGLGGLILDARLQRPDGYIMMAEILFEAATPGAAREQYLLHIKDVTGRKVVEEQLWAEAQAASYQFLIECIGDGFLVLDHEEEIIYANSSAERILRHPRQDLIRRRLADLFPELATIALAETLGADGRPTTIQVSLLQQGEPHSFEFGIHPHRDGIGILFRDVSERVKAELEIAMLNATMRASQELLRRKNEELNTSLEKVEGMNERLAQADRLKGEFLANTSHELRTPLNSIIGFLQLIAEGLCESREEEQAYIHNAKDSATHLLALINDVLDIAKIEAGKMTLLVDDINMETLFHDIYSMAHIQAQQKGLSLAFEIRDKESACVRADFHKARQVLINLVGNSIKFTDRGGILVWAEPDTERGDMMRISVRDSGIGIAPDKQRAIFEKFIQVDGTSTRRHQGTGLGLTISRNLVEMMGGQIRVHSAGVDQGTTMSFTLPLGSTGQDRRDARELDPAGQTLAQSF